MKKNEPSLERIARLNGVRKMIDFKEIIAAQGSFDDYRTSIHSTHRSKSKDSLLTRQSRSKSKRIYKEIERLRKDGTTIKLKVGVEKIIPTKKSQNQSRNPSRAKFNGSKRIGKPSKNPTEFYTSKQLEYSPLAHMKKTSEISTNIPPSKICWTKDDWPVIKDIFSFHAKIGSGGFSSVYKAIHKKGKEIVAVKVIPKKKVAEPHKREMIEREVLLLQKTNHPNIVRYKGLYEDKKRV